MSHPDYSAAVWQYFNDASRAGLLPEAQVSVRAQTHGSRAVMAIQAAMQEGLIADARFQVYGCVSAIACGAWLAQWLVGKSADDLARLTASEINEALALAPVKRHCALLAEDAARMIGQQWGQMENTESMEATA